MPLAAHHGPLDRAATLRTAPLARRSLPGLAVLERRAVHVHDVLADPEYEWGLGQEGAGVVERVGARVTRVRPGDHVVLTFLTCGVCRNCLRGMPAYCPSAPALNFAGAPRRLHRAARRLVGGPQPLLRTVVVRHA